MLILHWPQKVSAGQRLPEQYPPRAGAERADQRATLPTRCMVEATPRFERRRDRGAGPAPQG